MLNIFNNLLQMNFTNHIKGLQNEYQSVYTELTETRKELENYNKDEEILKLQK